MSFFKEIAASGCGLDISIKVKEKNGKLTVMVTPEISNKAVLYGKVITATPEELDNDFFTVIKTPPAEPTGTSVQDLPTEQKTISKVSESKKETKSSAKKQDSKNGRHHRKNDPTIQEQSMFDQAPVSVSSDKAETVSDDENTDEDNIDIEDQTDSETE